MKHGETAGALTRLRTKCLLVRKTEETEKETSYPLQNVEVNRERVKQVIACAEGDFDMGGGWGKSMVCSIRTLLVNLLFVVPSVNSSHHVQT